MPIRETREYLRTSRLPGRSLISAGFDVLLGCSLSVRVGAFTLLGDRCPILISPCAPLR